MIEDWDLGCPDFLDVQVMLIRVSALLAHLMYSLKKKEKNLTEENLGATAPMVGRICPPGWNRVKVSEILGATGVAPVAPVNISLVREHMK